MRVPMFLVLVAAGCTDPSVDDVSGEDTDEVTVPGAPWPDWAFAHWVWEDESTQDSLIEMVDGYEAHDIDVGAVIIDSPWATGYNTFEWDTGRFPDPQGLIDDLHARDIRVMLWIVPAVNVDVQPLYDAAAAAGYFMQTDADSGPAVIDWWKGDGSLLDYHNSDAVAWWHELMQPVLEMGIDGWKCDGLDFSASFARYSPAKGEKIDRLEYSHLYYRDFFDHTRDVLGDDRLITARPIDNYGADIGTDVVAFAPVDITWAGWVGDQDATFDGLKAALRNMYWSSEYGYLAFGSDIGGYREDDAFENGRGKEVFLRWAQVGALNPVMENGGGGEHWPWRFDDETVEIYRSFVDLHYALLPYLTAEGAVAFEAGTSLMQFTDKETYQYRLGPDVFVAPVLEEGGAVTVTLPDGDWVYLFDETVVHHGSDVIDLVVPLDEAAVFVRQGSSVFVKAER